MNGSDPPRKLNDSDFQQFKNGVHVSRGAFAGCIKTPIDVHHWIKANRAGTEWEHHTGTPDANQTEIPADVWDKCKDGGTFTWNANDEVWEDTQSQAYRWAGPTSGGYVAIKEF